jgi:chromosome partitioning protein
MTRLLRAFGIGKRAAQIEPERYAGQAPRTPAPEESVSAGDQSPSGSPQAVAPSVPVGRKPGGDARAQVPASPDGDLADADVTPRSIELGTTEIAGRLPAPSPAQDVPEASDLPDPASNAILAGPHGGSAEARTGQQVDQAASPEQAFQAPAAEQGVQGDGSSDHSRSGVGHRGAVIRPTHVDWFSPSTVTEETPAIVGDGSAGAEEQPFDPPSSSTQPRPRPETLWLTSADAAVEDPANERKSGGSIAGSLGTDLEARAEDHAESRLAEARRSEPSGPQLQEQPQQEGSEGAGRSTAASMGDGDPSASSRFSPVSGSADSAISHESTRTPAFEQGQNGRQLDRGTPGSDEGSEDSRGAVEPGHGTGKGRGETPTIGDEPAPRSEAPPGLGQPPEWLASEPEGAHTAEPLDGQAQHLPERPQSEASQRPASAEPAQPATDGVGGPPASKTIASDALGCDPGRPTPDFEDRDRITAGDIQPPSDPSHGSEGGVEMPAESVAMPAQRVDESDERVAAAEEDIPVPGQSLHDPRASTVARGAAGPVPLGAGLAREAVGPVPGEAALATGPGPGSEVAKPTHEGAESRLGEAGQAPGAAGLAPKEEGLATGAAPGPATAGLAAGEFGLAAAAAGLATAEVGPGTGPGSGTTAAGLPSAAAGFVSGMAASRPEAAGPGPEAGAPRSTAPGPRMGPGAVGPSDEAAKLGPGEDGPTFAEQSRERQSVGLEPREPDGNRRSSGEGENERVPDEVTDLPPGLEPGLQEIVRRLVPPSGPGRAHALTVGGQPANEAPAHGDGGASAGGGDAEGEKAVVEREDGRRSEAAQPSSATSANHPQEENISPARSASKRGRGRMRPKSSPGGKHRPNVSRETLSLGEVADNVGEDKVMEDEAAIAVREAALRAAAEVPGANDRGQRDAPPDPQDDVSRETSRSQSDPAGGPSAEAPTVDKGVAPPEKVAPTIDIERAARDARVTFQIAHGAYNRFAIAVANQKGGVGKSTTAVNLGAYLALAGARVLVVDLDPQGNASTGLGLDHRQIEPSVYDVLMGDSDAASAIRQTPVRNLDVLPSTIDLAGAEVELVNAFSRETRLRQALGAVRYSYDLVFIDCPPSLGLLTVNALAAADELLIPIQCEYYALEGLGQLLRNVDLVRVNLNQGLHIGGIVLTMYDGRTRLAEQVVQEVRKHFTDLVYQTVVPRSVRLSEAPGYGVPIALYDPLSRGGIAYRDLALELADRTGLLAPTREGAN